VCDGGPNPPLTDVVSDFDAGLGASLELLNCATVLGGEVVVEDLTMGEYCWVYTTGSHRLACSSVTFRVLEAGTQELGVQRFVYIREPGGPGDMQLLQEGGGFSLAPLTLVDSTFQLPRDSWWRLSADEDTLTFETSTDGETWMFRGSGAPSFPLTDVTINIGAGQYLAGPVSGTARFDCLNVPPPCGD